MCSSSRFWSCGSLDCGSQFYHTYFAIVCRAQLWRSITVCSSWYLHTRAHCAQCLHSIPLWLASQVLAPAWGNSDENTFSESLATNSFGNSWINEVNRLILIPDFSTLIEMFVTRVSFLSFRPVPETFRLGPWNDLKINNRAWDLGMTSKLITERSKEYERNLSGANEHVFPSQPRFQNQSIKQKKRKARLQKPTWSAACF